MRISHNPGAAIEQCLTWQYQQHGGIDTTAPTNYTPSTGKRYRVTHDTKTGDIKVIPWVRHETKSTRPGRMSTTSKVATGMDVGEVLAAAFGKHQARCTKHRAWRFTLMQWAAERRLKAAGIKPQIAKQADLFGG